MDQLLDLIDTCIVSVRGKSKGTGWFVGPDLVATSRHVAGTRPFVAVDGKEILADSVMPLADSDFVLVRLAVRRGLWLLLAQDWTLDERCIVRASLEGVPDTAIVSIEGTRGAKDRYDLKVSDGQITPGFSGAPVISLASGRVVGQVHKTRNKALALGGFLVPATAISSFLRTRGYDVTSRSVSSRWLAAAGGKPVATLSPPPPPALRFQGRTEVMAQIRASSPGSVRLLIGAPGSGKTAVLSAWMSSQSVDHLGNSYSTYAYIDLSGYRMGRNPVLRALAEHLGVLTDSKERQALEHDDLTAAYIQLGIRKRLSDLPSGLAFDSGESLFRTRDGLTALTQVLKSGLLGWAAVVVVAWAPGPELPIEARVRPTIIVGPLNAAEAAGLFADESGLDQSTVDEVITLLDEDQRLPGVLVSTAGRLMNERDAFEIAQLLTDVHANHLLGRIVRIARTVDAGDLIWPKSLARALAPERYAEPEEDTLGLIEALGWQEVSGRLTGQNKLAALNLLSDAVLTNRLDDEVTTDISELLVNIAPREVLEKLVFASDWASNLPTGRALRSRARDRIARLTVNEPLGAVVVQSGVLRELAATESVDTPADLLMLARTSMDPKMFIAALRRIPRNGRPMADPRDAVAMKIIRSAFAEVENRFNFQVESVVAREMFLELLSPELPDEFSVEYLEILRDSVQGLATISRDEDAHRRLLQLTEGLAKLDEESSFGEPNSRRRLEVAVLLLRVSLGLENAVAALDAIEERLEGDDSQYGVFAIATLLDLGAARGIHGQRLAESLGRLLDQVSAISASDTRAAIVSRAIAVVRSAGVELPSVLRIDLLRRAHVQADLIREDARLLARYDDARPMSAIIRLTLTLSSELGRSLISADRSSSRRLRLEAIATLDDITTEAPNATLWGLYMRAVDRLGPSAYDPNADPTWISGEQLKSADAVVRLYRKWSRSRSITSAREFENEIWILRRSWAREGSILRAVSADDPEWYKTPLGLKLEMLESMYNQRLMRLASFQKRWPGQTEIVLERFRVERQYQRAVAQYTGGLVDDDAVLGVLDQAMRERGLLSELVLARASYLRYVGRVDEAISELEELRRGPAMQRDVARDARIVLARALLDKATRQSDQDVDALCSHALSLIGNLEDADSETALLALQIRLELARGFLPSIAEELWQLFTTAGQLSEVWTQRELFELCEQLLIEAGAARGLRVIAAEFTSPRILIRFAALLIRWFVLISDGDIKRLEAALVAMEGARIFAVSASTTEQLAYLQGRALLLACESTGSKNPFGWGPRVAGVEVDDLELAYRRLQSARDRSVGTFRTIVDDHIDRAKSLRLGFEGVNRG